LGDKKIVWEIFLGGLAESEKQKDQSFLFAQYQKLSALVFLLFAK
jgi:hypothetical protein